jgi:peptidoglycan-N-acetylglucosamine deacetylase
MFGQFKKYRNEFLHKGIPKLSNYPMQIEQAVLRTIVGSITGVRTLKNIVAFTFDDGPHPEYTPRLVEILNKYNARATFFMVGESAQKYPEVVKYVASSGHVIGNHTLNHPAMAAVGRRERIYQILACEQLISPYGQKLFRPPYGFQTISSYLDVRIRGYKIITWSKSVEDWLDHDAERLAKNITKVLKPGYIILMHDALYNTLSDKYADRTQLLDAIEIVLCRHINKFSFVTVPELLQSGRVRRTPWFRPPDLKWLNSLNNGTARQY